MNGAAVVLARPGRSADPAYLAGLIRDQGITIAHFVPSMLREFLAQDGLGRLRSLRQLHGGGEAVPAAMRDQFFAAIPDCELYQVYGPTEVTITASGYQCAADDTGTPPIGRPTGEHPPVRPGRAAAAGAAGGNRRAVHRRRRDRPRLPAAAPPLTAERFIAYPFGPAGTRMYRTGDRARWRADGHVVFLGRADNQLKVRGFRVEPGEVEAVLAAHPGVRAAVVTAMGTGGDRLAAFLVPADPGAGIPAAADVREFLRRSLPDYLVPAAFTELASLPLTPSGKLDRAALPAPDAARPGSGVGFVAPAGVAEELLAGIWAQVLGVERVGATDGFFELGGHSLLATQVMSRVREVFGAEVPLAGLFDHPTVRGLAAVIEGAAGVTASPAVLPVSRDQRLPLSFAQQRLWFLDQLEPGSTEYNLPSAVRLGRDVDVAALAAALDAVVARHEVLRTRLVAGPDGVAYQVIDPPARSRCRWPTCPRWPGRLPAAARLVAQDADEPFDLAAGPLLRACLVRLGAGGPRAGAVRAPRGVRRVVGARSFRRELLSLYDAFRRGDA